jgi:hypothetical protein
MVLTFQYEQFILTSMIHDLTGVANSCIMESEVSE